jgi:dinuclear metal center YbgI/SA1388 family protein
MQVKEITRILEDVAPLSYQESYDNSGLIVGNNSDEVTGVLISLDCTEDVVDEAISLGLNMIVSHHPIVFEGLKKLNGKNYVERTVIKAIQNNIALYAIHTNLDNISNGVNKRICDKLGLVNVKTLSPKSNLLSKLSVFCPKAKSDDVRKALFEVGCGSIGEYDQCSFNTDGVGTFRAGDNSQPFVGEQFVLHEEQETKIEVIFPSYLQNRLVVKLKQVHPYEEVAFDIFKLENKHESVGSGMIGELSESIDELEFLKSLKKTMETNCVRYTPLTGRVIKRIAVCGGSGSFLLPQAKANYADVFITGDVKYHEFFNAEGELVIADIGHYESEQFTKELIYDTLMEKLPTFALHLSKVNTNPINYL